MRTPQTKQPMRAELIAVYRKALKNGISLERIEEKIDQHIDRLQVTQRIEGVDSEQQVRKLARKLPAVVRLGALIVPILFLAIGFYLVGSAVVPILGYYTQGGNDVQTHTLIAPIPQSEIMDTTPLVASLQSAGLSTAPEVEIIDTELDYTNLANWFSQEALPDMRLAGADSAITEYTIDIPKLKIENAKVAIGGTDLNESLIAYSGTALPGKPGAPVIFGHSVLRQFYNPSEKNPRRYNSIFSTIMTLKNGDPIYVTVDGVKYTYVVNHKTEVKPEDVYILLQKYDSKQLKLVTCTPEGTYLRRGVVTAQLVE